MRQFAPGNSMGKKSIIFFRAPHDCSTYKTGASGFITSYGQIGQAQPTNMAFTHCIRREMGYCAISYTPAITGSTTIDTFEIADDTDTVFVSFSFVIFLVL